jgi:hypothetical protein
MAALYGSKVHGERLRVVVFDVPILAGADLRPVPWREGREKLELLAQAFVEPIALSRTVFPNESQLLEVARTIQAAFLNETHVLRSNNLQAATCVGQLLSGSYQDRLMMCYRFVDELGDSRQEVDNLVSLNPDNDAFGRRSCLLPNLELESVLTTSQNPRQSRFDTGLQIRQQLRQNLLFLTNIDQRARDGIHLTPNSERRHDVKQVGR